MAIPQAAPRPGAAARVNEIDLLRFVAALSVLFYHYAFRGYAADDLSAMPYPALAPLAKYGYLGVELFFMISGFVILMSVRGGSLRDFAISRVVRLYPAYWACCSISMAAIVLLGAPRFHVGLGQFIANLTMLHGFVGIDSVDGAYWSLAVEMRFYGFVALVLLLGQLARAQALLGLWLALALVIEVFPNGKLHTLLIVDYAAYFAAGALFYLTWRDGWSRARAALIGAAWLLALWQVWHSLDAFERHYHTDMNRPLVLVIVTGFFAVMALVASRRTGAIGRRQWVLAGALTYPVYLLHQNLGYILFNTLYPELSPHLLLALALLLVLALAYLVHARIERRVARPLRGWLGRRWDGLALLARR